MKYKVDGWSNFCRVFELPASFSNDYCFGGGYPVGFKMVDWFNPVMGLGQPAIPKEVWREEVGEIEIVETTEDQLRETLIPFLADKQYVRTGRTYLVLCDFGAAFVFEKTQGG